MYNRIFGSSSEDQQSSANIGEPFVLLVIQADNYDWQEIMKTSSNEQLIIKTKENNKSRSLQIVQTSWDDLTVGPCDNYYHDPRHRCMVTVRKLWKNGKSTEPSTIGTSVSRVIFPDFVLIRNEVVVPQKDFKNKLLGLMYSNVPSLNSLLSVYLTIERPIMMAALNKIANPENRKQANLRNHPMPLVPQQFFPSHNGMIYGQRFPAVVKFGSAHAGFGKMVVNDHHQMEDVHSVLPMTTAGYCFGEPFLEGACDLRLQKIGSSYRAFKRTNVCGNWKTQTGTAVLEKIEVTDKYKEWLDATAVMFGEDEKSGKMDLLTLDVLVEEGSGKEYVLECNGTSSGLSEEEAREDNLILAKLVLEKIEKLI